MTTSINRFEKQEATPTSLPSHRRSVAFSYSPASMEMSRADVTLVNQTAAAAISQVTMDSWGLQNLANKDKKKIIPCVQSMEKEFQTLHRNAMDATKQRKYFFMGATGISVGTGVSSYCAASYPMECACFSGCLSCAAFALGYFVTKAQSDYSVNIKADQDKLCQKLKRQYENLGKDLIVKYVEARGSIQNEANEKLNQSPKKPQKLILDQAMAVLNNWENIKAALSARLIINLESASDTALPLYEATLALINDNVQPERSEVETSMQTYFKEQRANYTIKQIEAEKIREDKARWEKLYEDIQTNKLQVEAEAAKRLEIAKKEIAEEAKKQAVEATRQIEAAKNQAAIEATSKSHTQLEEALASLETTAKHKAEETAKQWELTTQKLEQQIQSQIAVMAYKTEKAITQALHATEGVQKASEIAVQAIKENVITKKKVDRIDALAMQTQADVTSIRKEAAAAKKEAEAARGDTAGLAMQLRAAEELAKERERKLEQFIKKMEEARVQAEKIALDLAMERKAQILAQSDNETPVKLSMSFSTSNVVRYRPQGRTTPLSQPKTVRDKVYKPSIPAWK